MLRIKLVDPTDILSVENFCNGKLLGTKILCLLKAYGLDTPFLTVWYCTDEDENTAAVICNFDGNVTVIEECKDDIEELSAFLDFVGWSSLCCTERTSVRLRYDNAVIKNAYMYNGEESGCFLDELTEDYYKKCYMLICENIPDSFEDSREAYLSFLSDFTYRKRRNLARMKGYTENGNLYSCALTSAETEEAAIISGVACDMSARKSGLGKKTVLSIVEELQKEGKDVYVIALNEAAEGFYEHIGFRFTEQISFIERK
ncbi:MAG: GNAT family N-acetyltransferase [Clostridia bacterium]|nr:GNAT family N-acetyltransferase [Clostridia bacterium]